MNIEQIREKFKGAYVSSYEKAQKRESDGKYLSDRHNEDIPLVCQELNILTVEDYDKWYGLYYLMEDPNTKEIMLVTLAWGDILEGIDHEFYPDSIIKFCMKNDLKIDKASFLCINKSLLAYDNYNDDILKNHLAMFEDIGKVIIDISNSISHAFNVSGKYDSYIDYSYEAHQIHKLNIL